MTVNAAAELAPHGTADRLPSQTIVPRRIPSDPSPARAMLQRGPKGPESLLPLECSSGHRDFQLTKSLNINRLKTACCEEVDVERDGELEEVMLRFYEAWNAGDAASVSELVSS